MGHLKKCWVGLLAGDRKSEPKRIRNVYTSKRPRYFSDLSSRYGESKRSESHTGRQKPPIWCALDLVMAPLAILLHIWSRCDHGF